MPLKLGKLAPKAHRNTLLFNKYAGPNLPDAPTKVYWSYRVPDDAWGMLGNDVAGDCVVAGAMHVDMLMSAHTGAMRRYTTDQAIQLYSRLTGYDPATGTNDTGLVMTDFLEFWRTEGIDGQKILGWAKVDLDPVRLDQATWLFAAAYTGVEVPQSAMDQFNAGQTWEVVPNSPVEGGHCIPAFNYGSLGRKFVTWGAMQPALNDWVQKYMDEAYAVISEAWFDVTTGLAPNHFDRDALWADLKAL